MNNNSLPLISVIIPVYKVEPYLKRCVDSVLNQTYTNLEIILVDDGSPDMCPQMCDEYAAADTRIRVIHKKNGGLSSARNAGIDACKGEYISFVDSDDFISCFFIEFLYRAVIEKCADVGVAEYHSFEQNVFEQKIEQDDFTVEEQSFVDVMARYSSLDSHESMLTIVSWNKLYKVKLFEDVRFPDGKLYEDAATTYKILNQCEKIAFLNLPLYYYYLRTDSISGVRAFSDRYLDLYHAIKDSYCFFLEKNNGLVAHYIVPQLLKVGIYSWWGMKYALKQSNPAEEILLFLRENTRCIETTQYFSRLQKILLLLLLRCPVLYAVYRSVVPGLMGRRK